MVAPQVSFGFTPGDVIVVTGAGSGIGRAIALRAAEVGLAVGAWDINEPAVRQVADEIVAAGGRAVACPADVTDDNQIAAALDATAALGAVRYLVNNAGPASASNLEFDQALAMSIGSMRRVTDHWLRRPRPEGCALVNIASVAGTRIGSAPDWYPAAKAAVMGWTRHLATYRVAEVRANAVAPGLTDTPRMAGFADSPLGQRIVGRIPVGRLGTPDDMAWTTLFLLSPLASYINGEMIVVDGGWTIAQ
ncbi:MAG: SDR family oxidoreductase [Micromonosporaceae bacterium]|nr:SDR family oxidoreductase [Micromonosporaceae bacterium]